MKVICFLILHPVLSYHFLLQSHVFIQSLWVTQSHRKSKTHHEVEYAYAGINFHFKIFDLLIQIALIGTEQSVDLQ